MQRVRVMFATALLFIAGFSAVGRRAFAAPGSAGATIPPQACSTGGAGSSGVGSGTLGFGGSFGGGSGYSGGGSYGGGSSGGGGGSGGSGGSDIARPKHKVKRAATSGVPVLPNSHAR